MKFKISTNGRTDFIDITAQVSSAIEEAKVKEGIAHVFVAGSTAAITSVEFEDGVLDDIRDVLEKICPEDYDYKHHKRWGDHNGAAHIRSAMIGPDFSAPVSSGKLQLGAWQQIVLVDFDERPRTREVIVTVIPE